MGKNRRFVVCLRRIFCPRRVAIRGTLEAMRTFVAIALSDFLLGRLASLQDKLEKLAPPHSVRWVRPKGIHLTLKFLGDTSTAKLPEIEQALAAVARHAPACCFTVGKLGCFPNSRRPRNIWVGVQEPTGRLAALQHAIGQVLVPLGYTPEQRAFTPHLTLGRVHHRAAHSEAAQLGQLVTNLTVDRLGEGSGNEFALIRSELKSAGAEYTTLRAFPLSDADS